MNASRMRKDGRNAFCPEDTPEEYFKRVGRNPSLYALRCFKEGWDEEANEYEKSQSVSVEEDSPLSEIKYGHDHVYFCSKNSWECFVLTSHPDDGACLIVERLEDNDLSDDIAYSESCYLTHLRSS